jgi:hypothetical protein
MTMPPYLAAQMSVRGCRRTLDLHDVHRMLHQAVGTDHPVLGEHIVDFRLAQLVYHLVRVDRTGGFDRAEIRGRCGIMGSLEKRWLASDLV